MANYRRFVTYFYDYSSGNKGGICGFGKLEYSVRSRVHITIQAKRTGREECVVYGMGEQEKDNQILGRFVLNGGKGSFLWEWNGKEKNADLFVRNMIGIVICLKGDGREEVWAATQWNGGEFEAKTFFGDKVEIAEEIMEEQVVEEEKIEAKIEEKIIEEKIIEEIKIEEEKIEEKDMIWNQLCRKYAKFMPFPQSTHIQCLKIHLGDLRRFSGENRRLANNNFLLRGYYRCHYIVVSKWDTSYYIGIPGIYQEREAKLASHFGFCMFAPFRGGNAANGKGGLWLTPLNLMEEKEEKNL